MPRYFTFVYDADPARQDLPWCVGYVDDDGWFTVETRVKFHRAAETICADLNSSAWPGGVGPYGDIAREPSTSMVDPIGELIQLREIAEGERDELRELLAAIVKTWRQCRPLGFICQDQAAVVPMLGAIEAARKRLG